MTALLQVQDLSCRFKANGKMLNAVSGVSFDVEPGKTIAIVGESGCGKSVTSMSILRLLDERYARLSGTVGFEGRNLLQAGEREMRRIRGNDISMIFQEPMTSLNPVLTVGRQIEEVLRLHKGLSRPQAAARTIEMLEMVGIPAPERRIREYPHQLSGGMRQRVMIGIALACEPKLLIADEPTTALDVTIQAQILDLMRDLQSRLGTAIILITHDLGVVAEMADSVVVMYAGRKVEQASVGEIFSRPLHPYTRGLLGAMPRLGHSQMSDERVKLSEIRGTVPPLHADIVGCAFQDRCALVQPLCKTVPPVLEPKTGQHLAACHFANGGDR